MEQHPIPRQITTFEFKLVGFLTIKQFIYLIIFAAIGFIVYLIFPIPILNIFFALITAGAGAALAFLPVNDRPLDVWIKNLVRRLLSPTQYQYKKNNPPPAFLKNIPAASTPSQVSTHIDAQKKLNNYLGSKNAAVQQSKKQSINDLMQNSLNALVGKGVQKPAAPSPSQKPSVGAAPRPDTPKKPFFTGLIKNHKDLPLYGILIYVRTDEKATPVRILKTNVNGVFATFNNLTPGEYLFEPKDPNGVYFFDTMKIKIEESNPHPFQILSKELL